MSQSFASGRDLTKNTCANCKRTVVWEVLDDGTRVATDTELIAVVVKISGAGARPTSRARREVRRIHAEQCEKYKLDDAKVAFRKEQAKLAKKNGARSQVAPELGVGPVSAHLPPVAPPPKYTTIAEAKRAVLASLRAVEKLRAKL